MCRNNKVLLYELAIKNKRRKLTYPLKEILLLMALVKFELVFAMIIGIRKHVDMLVNLGILILILILILTVSVV